MHITKWTKCDLKRQNVQWHKGFGQSLILQVVPLKKRKKVCHVYHTVFL